ncbi:chemotaxis response regulator protein-glutamate methylesterase [Puniceicoccaceae bacterium K14]|nr:chemotaxis response regulator protein-glutamate methylesterase [Puniceicoccaceae bacterium K14]
MSDRKIEVMVVDDSATARRILSDIVNKSPNMRVCSSVADPYEAVAQLKKSVPDVMILDVQMPRMDGITFLKKLMKQHPLPVIMCSSFTEKGSSTSLECLENGAVEIIAKPKIANKMDMLELEMRIHDVILSSAQARFRSVGKPRISSVPPPQPAEQKQRVGTERNTPDALLPPPSPMAIAKIPVTQQKIIAVGASTGGTDAIRNFLEQLPADCPGIVIVQHMPEHFTKSFADRLNATCPMAVKEAEPGDVIEPGRVLIAPGSHHMMVRRSGQRYSVELKDGPLVSRHRPSVDVLFRSVASSVGRNAVGVILTGMGDDGAVGMLEMKQAGSYNIAQDRQSCVVFGMPNEAMKQGGVHETLPLGKIGTQALAKSQSSSGVLR